MMSKIEYPSGGLGRRLAALLVAGFLLAGVPAWMDAAEGGRSLATILEERIAAGDLEYRDSRTGEVVVATAERVAELRSNLERHFAQPPVFNERVNANGAVVAVVGDAIRDVQLVRINLDGTRTTACMRDLDAAVAFLIGLDTVENKATGDRPVLADR